MSTIQLNSDIDTLKTWTLIKALNVSTASMDWQTICNISGYTSFYIIVGEKTSVANLAYKATGYYIPINDGATYSGNATDDYMITFHGETLDIYYPSRTLQYGLMVKVYGRK